MTFILVAMEQTLLIESETRRAIPTITTVENMISSINITDTLRQLSSPDTV
jgi:hypothetical protein